MSVRRPTRVLVVSNTPFLPPTAGNRQRINAMLGYLGSRGLELSLLMLPAADLPQWDVPAMRARCAQLEVAHPPRFARLASRLAARALPARPPSVDGWCPRWFRARAAAVARGWAPDVVLVEYVFLSACLEGVPAGTLKVIDTHDLMHLRRDVYTAAGMSPQWFHTTYADEQRGLARADVVLAIQEEEATVLRSMLPGKQVLTVPHGLAGAVAPFEASAPRRLLYVASCNDLHVRGLRWFAERVWPEVHGAVPDAELHVCGTICEKLSGMPAGIVLRGPVALLAEEYARARVVINPVPAGTGLAIKVVEALAHGRPVVATSPGSTGVGGGEVLVADDPAQFARSLHRVLLDDGFARALTTAAAGAARRFAPDAAFGPLIELFEGCRPTGSSSIRSARRVRRR